MGFPLLDDQTFEVALFAPVRERFAKAPRAIWVMALEKTLPVPSPL
jgi:hypothetical protein